MQAIDFTAVLAQAKDGDETAYQVLWSRYAPGVAGYLRGRGSLEPDDQTSEVFLAVFRSLAQFVGDEPAFRAYVYTITHRRLVDEHRRRSCRITETTWELDRDDRASTSAEDTALERVGTEEVRVVLEQLPVSQRDVLLLRLVDDLTVDQIAMALGKPRGAVKALQRRGLARLRRQLAAGQPRENAGSPGVYDPGLAA